MARICFCSRPVFGTDKLTGIGYCNYHQYKRTDKKKKERKVYIISKRKKATGEAKIFNEIAQEREPVSFISEINVPLVAGNFAHVLSKKQRPDLRLKKINIVLLTEQEHYLYDFGTESQREIYAKEKKEEFITVNWDKLFKLRDGLK